MWADSTFADFNKNSEEVMVIFSRRMERSSSIVVFTVQGIRVRPLRTFLHARSFNLIKSPLLVALLLGYYESNRHRHYTYHCGYDSVSKGQQTNRI